MTDVEIEAFALKVTNHNQMEEISTVINANIESQLPVSRPPQ